AVGRGEAGGVAEDGHAGRPGGLDAGPAVLDHGAAGRLAPPPGGGGRGGAGRVGPAGGGGGGERVGGGLAVGDLVAAEDPALEPVVEAGVAEGEAELVVAAAGGDPGRGGDFLAP